MKAPKHCGQNMVRAGFESHGGQRYKCKVCKSRVNTPPSNSKSKKIKKEVEVPISNQYAKQLKSERCQKFVITAAQNNTRVHEKFLTNLHVYCKINNAKLIVLPIHYKNISLFTVNKEYKKDWDNSIKPFLVNEKISLGGNVTVRPEKINATAVNPLSGLESIGGSAWCLYGHTQQAMTPVATPGGKKPKRTYTTGACTIKNYSNTKEGAKADFNHIIGALVVEVYKNHAFVRQINAHNDGSFHDLDCRFFDGTCKMGIPIIALTTGDEHEKFMLNGVRKATYTNDDSIVNFLRPSLIFRHDTLDGYAGSHHHIGNDLVNFKKFHNGDNDYRKELDSVVEHVRTTTPDFAKTVFVPSNHQDHLNIWLKNVDLRTDHTNSLLALELMYKQRLRILAGESYDPFEIYMKEYLTGCNFEFADRNTPYLVKGVDYSQHGDVGINGSRGSARGMSKTTYKMVIGHTHGSRIEKGVYQVGTSTGRLEYERGLGDHTNTHCIQYQDGKRTLIDIYQSEWRGK